MVVALKIDGGSLMENDLSFLNREVAFASLLGVKIAHVNALCYSSLQLYSPVSGLNPFIIRELGSCRELWNNI